MTYTSFLWQRVKKLMLNPAYYCLGLSIALSFALLIFRMMITHERMFAFLVWNLFLAGLPLLASTGLRFLKLAGKFKWYYVLPIGIFWLAFLPNSPYILTDLVHLKARGSFPFWLDLIVILSFAWTGLIMGFISLRDVQDIVNDKYNSFWGWLFTLCVIAASSFGIYLGRELRWNSWDILTNPNELLNDISTLLLNPTENLTMVAMTGAFTAFLLVSYLTIGNFRQASNELS